MLILGLEENTVLEFRVISPPSGSSKPAIQFNKVDLPLADGPKMPVIPFPMADCIDNSKSPYLFVTFNSIDTVNYRVPFFDPLMINQ
jgi:hypothetical protein